MGWTVKWHLEKQGNDGVWHELPKANSPECFAYANGHSDGIEAVESYSLDRCVSCHLANDGFPADPSATVEAGANKWVNYAAVELLTPPMFGWVLVQSIFQADWSQTPVDPFELAPRTWAAWLESLKQLGREDQLRFVFVWLR